MSAEAIVSKSVLPALLFACLALSPVQARAQLACATMTSSVAGCAKTDGTTTLTVGGVLSTGANVPTLSGNNTFSGTDNFSTLQVGGHALAIGGALTFSGAFSFTGTLTSNTAVTFPTSGQLAVLTGTPTPGNIAVINPAGTGIQDSGQAPITSAGGGTVWGNAGSSSAAPSFLAGPVLGVPAATGGTLGLANGGAGGATVTLGSGATANYTLNLPAAANTGSGQALVSGSPMNWSHVIFSTSTSSIFAGAGENLVLDTNGTGSLSFAANGSGVGNYGNTHSSSWTFLNNLYLPSLATTGTIAGSMCMTSAGEVLYESGASSCTISLRALKHGIAPEDRTLGKVMALKPVAFTFNAGDGRQRVGFIAEDVHGVDPRCSTYDGAGKLQGYDPNCVIALLTRAVQQQQGEIERLQKPWLWRVGAEAWRAVADVF